MKNLSYAPFLLFLLFTGFAVNGALAAGKPIITSIQTAYPQGGNTAELTIKGDNFLLKDGTSAFIAIGDNLPYQLINSSKNQLTVSADLPQGDYLIMVSTSNKFSSAKTATYDLTVGAVGVGGIKGMIDPQCSSGNPVAYIPGRSFTSSTDSNKRFQLDNVPPGTYDVVLDLKGNSPATKTLPGITVTASTITDTNTTKVPDLSSDTSNCGSCGTACANKQICNLGTCACSLGQVLCSGSGCVDLTIDPQNCGTCGHVCANNQSCISGQCG